MRSAAPQVSVIIPCYNHGRFLAEAVDSVLGQTFGDVEVIVVDDGSTDDTPAVAARYGDRIRYLRKENAGLSAARNTGILAATGEFLLFLDSDDSLLPDALERHMDVVRAHPTGAVFHSTCRYFDLTGQVVEEYPARSLGADAFHTLLSGCCFSPNSLLIRRDAFANAGVFDTALRSSEDWDMWLRLAAADYEFVPVPEAVAMYRYYPGSMSKNLERMLRCGLAVIRKSRTYHPRCPRCRKAAARGAWFVQRFCFHLLRDELAALGEQGQSGRAAARLARQLLRTPSLARFLPRELYRCLLRKAVLVHRKLVVEKPQMSG